MNKIRTKVASRVAVVAALSLGFTAGAVGVASASTVGHRGQDWTQSQSWVKGIVSSYTAGSSISITSGDSTTPVTYTLTSATTIAGLATGATLAAGDKVSLVLSTTAPVTVTSITVETPKAQCVKGVVSAYTAGMSISITSGDSTTPVTYTLTSATTIAGLATGATLAAGDKVSLVLSTTTPMTVTSITMKAPEMQWVKGVVSAYTAGTSISITSVDSTTPVTYTLTSATTITGLSTGATLAVGDKVSLALSSTTPPTVTSITVEMPESMRIEAVVSAYTAGTSISVTTEGSTTPVSYTLTSATTITGLATGATLAAGENVDLVLSSTTPTTVTSIIVEANGEGMSGGHGEGSSGYHGDHHGGHHGHHGFQGNGSSKHDHGRK